MIFALLSVSVFAVGLSPAKVTLNFKPGLTINKTLYIINSGHETGMISPTITGDLSDYITVPPEIEITKDQYKIPFTISIELPDSLPPGINVGFVQLKGMLREKRNTIVAMTAVKGKIEVKVPFPDKHLEAELFIRKTYQKTVDFTLGLKNIGSEDIKEINALIRLLQDKKEVFSIYADPISLLSQNEGKISAMNQLIPTGNFVVDIDIEYDGKHLDLKDSLRVTSDKKTDGIVVKKAIAPTKPKVEKEANLLPFLLSAVLILVVLLIVIAIMHFSRKKTK